MNEQYDIIVLGTGLTECILSGIFSSEGKKVLHIDRNKYYGGETASLKLSELYQKFRPNESLPSKLDDDKAFKVDLIPKFMMANGEIVRFLTQTDVTRYLEFKQVSGTFVYRDGKLSKIPTNEKEGIASSLIGLVEKRRLQKFVDFIRSWKDKEDKGEAQDEVNLDEKTMAELYDQFDLEPVTRGLIGHSMALYLDDEYLTKPARETAERIVLYAESIARYGKSPFLYPDYGIGEMPQSFARLSAVYGGTFMMDRAVDEIVYENGKAVGIRSGEELAKANQIICDPTYSKEKTQKSQEKVVRAICLLKHAIEGTDNANSAQIIISQSELKRKHDVYVSVLSDAHNVCPKDMYLATVSTIVETDDPEQEIKESLDLLGPIEEKFVSVSEIEVPTGDGVADQLFISRSYDATSHVDTVCEDVKSIYRRMTGNELVLKQRQTQEQEQEERKEQ